MYSFFSLYKDAHRACDEIFWEVMEKKERKNINIEILIWILSSSPMDWYEYKVARKK